MKLLHNKFQPLPNRMGVNLLDKWSVLKVDKLLDENHLSTS